MRRLVACLVLVSLALVPWLGCTSPQSVSRTQFDHLKTERHEPKVSAWYYVGSKDRFHHFHHDDLGDDQKNFRISETELLWRGAFSLTRRPEKLRFVDWRGFGDLLKQDHPFFFFFRRPRS